MNDTPITLRLINQDGKEYPLTATTLIGRASDCNIQIDDDGISRHHAQLEISEGKVILQDLGSQNGTFVNEQRIQVPTELKEGDQIRIHNHLFTLKTAVQSDETQTAPFLRGPGSDETQTAGSNRGLGSGESRTEVYESPRLFTLVRSDNGAETGLSRRITIGRDETNTIPLPNDISASTAHAKIEIITGRAVLTDLDSRNGTWVNGVRITTPVYLSHGDKIRIGDTVFRLQEGEKPLAPPETPARTRSCWLVGCGSLLAGGMLLAVILAGISILPQILPKQKPTIAATATLQPTEIPGLVSTQQATAEQNALRALVLVLVKVEEGQYGGSGSLLDSRGYILTNFHVIGDPKTGKLHNPSEKITIGVNWDDPAQEPNTFYLCEITKFDADYDLALLHVISLADESPLPEDLVFPTIPIGDSDEVRIGDPIAVLGYPALGGMTPTFTRGTVSGFLADKHIGQDRGWIKTDTEINRGNSGGMAINSKGELIGIPTQAAFDVEVTGKISDIRPINLAQDVMSAIP